MRVNYCGALWTVVAMLGGAALNAGYNFVIEDRHGQTLTVSGASLSPA